MKNILVNLPTLQHETILPPWLRIFKYFQTQGSEIYVNTGYFIKRLPPIQDIYNYKWLNDIENEALLKDKTKTKFGFMFHSLKRNIISLKRYKKNLGDITFDVIYTPSSVLDLVALPYYLKLTGSRINWTTKLDNIVPVTDPGNRFIRFLVWIFFRVSLILLRKADVIFVISEDLRDFMLKGGFPVKKIVLSTNGIENDLIKMAKADDRYNVDALFAGRINETKGIYDMLKVLKIIVEKIPDFQLAIMGLGDTATERKFKAKIKETNLDKNVRFVGYKTGQEKYNFIKSAKCFWFLSVSKSESFGIALLEAVCSGIPAFAYNLPQFSRLYPNGEVNISPLGDYKSVAEKVLKLFARRDFTNEEGKKLLGKYSWEKIAETEYNAIISNLSIKG
jgi:glycosyltransferase involved in cell wall biosynthesis